MVKISNLEKENNKLFRQKGRKKKLFREKVRNSGLHKGRKNIEERISEVKINLFFLVLMYLSDNFC